MREESYNMRLMLWYAAGFPDAGTSWLTLSLTQLAEYGAALIEQNAGQHFTFVNVKQDTTADTIVQRSRGLVQCFEKNGITKDKIVVSIPATEQGVHATRLLAKEDGILVNLAMVAGMPHAAVCAEAGAAWITFHLGKVSPSHWHACRIC